ncbi:hypothetical protein TacPo2_93 [Pantoea bacteriophage TacPo2]
MSQLNSVTREFAVNFFQLSKSVSGIKDTLDGYNGFKAFLKLRKKLIEKNIREIKLMLKVSNGQDYAMLQRIRAEHVTNLHRLVKFINDLPKHRRGSEAAFEKRHAELLAMYDDAEKMGIDPIALVAEWKEERKVKDVSQPNT